MTYDLIIIGAGPAGITASVYAARKKMNSLLISKDIGGQAAWSGDIENYTGYQFITGPELTVKLQEHIIKYNIALKENEEALEVTKTGDVISVKTSKAVYQARAVIVASGKKPRELNVPGEKEFKNRGVAYCATCEGPLFANKEVAVVGGANSALDAAMQMAKIARQTYIINVNSALGGDAIMRQKLEASSAVKIFNNTQVIEILGEKFVSGVKIKTSQAEQILSVQGVFVEVGLIPNSDLIQGVEKNERSEIKIDCFNATSIPGIFSAGDVSSVPQKQIIIAAGEGAKAALSAFGYLARHKFDSA